MNSRINRSVLICVLGGAMALAACGEIETDEIMAPRQPLAAGPSGSLLGGDITYAGAVQAILVEHCSECHGSSEKTAGVDVTSYDALLGSGVIEPGDPDASTLVLVLEAGIMPPPGHDRPTAEEISAIRTWVELGAP